VIGAFDPIGPLADIAREHGLWLHVDGAFGGTALMHPEHRGLLAGLERADSFAWDAHKAMGVPLTCSVALTREPGLMRKHFDESASYLFQQDEDRLNPGTRSLQCGRRNDALKLWAQWQALGDAGYAERVGRQAALAQHAASIIRGDDRFVLSVEPEWLTVCFEAVGKSSEAVCARLTELGLLNIGYGIVNGRRVIRLVTSNASFGFGGDRADADRHRGGRGGAAGRGERGEHRLTSRSSHWNTLRLRPLGECVPRDEPGVVDGDLGVEPEPDPAQAPHPRGQGPEAAEFASASTTPPAGTPRTSLRATFASPSLSAVTLYSSMIPASLALACSL
jgi:hypothetical protein